MRAKLTQRGRFMAEEDQGLVFAHTFFLDQLTEIEDDTYIFAKRIVSEGGSALHLVSDSLL